MTHPLAHLNPDCMVVEDLSTLTRDLLRLVRYCVLREHAMRCREAGQIDTALRSEQRCEALYNDLPPEWRW